MAAENTVGMSLKDFMRLYYEEGAFELVDGKRVPVSTKMFGQINVANEIMLLLNSFARLKGVGRAYVDAPYVTMPDKESGMVTGSRVPDVMFVRAERLAEYKRTTPGWEMCPLTITPDLVVEIVGDADTYTSVMRRVNSYLKEGVRTVWVVEAGSRTVSVHAGGPARQPLLTEKDKLSGGEIIPGFEINVEKIFG
jgi:Uma2 family endonuclease